MKTLKSIRKSVLGLFAISMFTVGCGQQGMNVNAIPSTIVQEDLGGFQTAGLRRGSITKKTAVASTIAVAIKNNPEQAQAVQEQLAEALANLPIDLSSMLENINPNFCRGEQMVERINRRFIKGDITYTWSYSARLSAEKGEDVYLYKVTDRQALDGYKKMTFVNGPLNHLKVKLNPLELEAETQDLLTSAELYGELDQAITIPTDYEDVTIPLNFGTEYNNTQLNYRMSIEELEGEEELNTRSEYMLSGYLMPAFNFTLHPGDEVIFENFKVIADGKTTVNETSVDYTASVSLEANAQVWNIITRVYDNKTYQVPQDDIHKSKDISSQNSARLKRILTEVNHCQR